MRHVIIGQPAGGFRLAGRGWALGATSRTAKGTLVGGINRALGTLPTSAPAKAWR